LKYLEQVFLHYARPHFPTDGNFEALKGLWNSDSNHGKWLFFPDSPTNS